MGMLQKGEYVVYSWYGACKVDGMKEEVVGNNQKEYYILKPVNDPKSTVMIPVDTNKIRPILSKVEAEDLLQSVNSISVPWIENSRMRNTKYMEILKGRKMSEMLGMLKLLLNKREEMNGSGRKFSMQDSQILELTENYVFSELSVSLELDRDEIEDIIMV